LTGDARNRPKIYYLRDILNFPPNFVSAKNTYLSLPGGSFTRAIWECDFVLQNFTLSLSCICTSDFRAQVLISFDLGGKYGARTLRIMTFSINSLSMMTFSIMTLSVMTFSITTLSMMTFSMTTLRMMTFSMATLCMMTFNNTALSTMTFSIMTLSIMTFNLTTTIITKNKS
jgi:hypothetical protein